MVEGIAARGLAEDVTRARKRCAELKAEVERLRENAKRVQANLLREARLYQLDDGSPGPLSTQWGWRDMAKNLREAAKAKEKEDPFQTVARLQAEHKERSQR